MHLYPSPGHELVGEGKALFKGDKYIKHSYSYKVAKSEILTKSLGQPEYAKHNIVTGTGGVLIPGEDLLLARYSPNQYHYVWRRPSALFFTVRDV